MSEATDRARQYLAMAATSLEAMEVIGQAAKSLVSRGDAATLDEIIAVLAGIAAVSEVVSKGLAGQVTKDETDAAIGELRTGIEANNAAARAAVDQKFPRE
jgi:hypothetical protein